MNLKEVKTLIVGTIKQSFTNKKTLDKFDGASGTLKYNGVPVNNVPVFVADDSPVGNIIAFMGNTAPQDYLICDGSIYNIADYPLLAQHMLDEFGSYNYFGGDGESTFAVPDLRGEFLRGTGTATRNTGSGANVGIHQEPTQIPNIYTDSDNFEYVSTGINDTGVNGSKNIDKGYNYGTNGKTHYMLNAGSTVYNTATNSSHLSTRPTNTSVLYCIKYQITQNNISKDMVNYSTEEQVIGSWVNGKPIYQKVIPINSFSTGCDWKNIATAPENIDLLIYAEIPEKEPNAINRLEFTIFNGYIRTECINTQTTIPVPEDSYLIIQYTKTTDAENSFTPDMLSSIKANTTVTDDDVNDVLGGI